MRRTIGLVALLCLLLTGLGIAQKKPKAAAAPPPAPAPAPEPAPVAAPAPPPAVAAAPAAPRKKRVAVIDFDYATVHSGISALFGQDVDVGKGITDLLVTFLVKDGTYSVIERKALDKIMQEQNFSNSDRANPTSAAKLGNVGRKKSKAIVAITARLVDVDTGEIVGVAEGKGESQRESTTLLGAGAGSKGFGAGNADFTTSDFQNTILGEAVKAAVQQTSTEVIADKEKLVTRTVMVDGLVAAVDSGQIVLNVGSKAGVKVGDQLSVERVSKEIKDPSTGKVIRRLASQVGIIRVTDVDDISAVATAVTGNGFKTGDVVKTVSQ